MAHGRAPHAVFGTLWQWLWEKMPEEYELTVQRVPRFRRQPTLDGRNQKFLGWEFVCPGRMGENEQYLGCGKRCTYLYYPQPVWTLGKAIAGASDDGFEMPEGSGLAGQWFPGLIDTVAAAAPHGRSFACKDCWGVRSVCMTGPHGWNDFVTHISGGLLSGRDVPRPKDICPVKRKKRIYRRRRKSAPPPDSNVTERARAGVASG